MKPYRFALPLLALMSVPVVLTGCTDLSAQEKAKAEKQEEKAVDPMEARLAPVQVKAEELAPGVAVLFGAGGNMGVSHGEDGTVLIDDQFAPLTGKIQTAIADLGATPVKFLINTHWHHDHSGGNENFGKEGAVIMAHENVRVRMAKGSTVAGREVAPAPAIAQPVLTYKDGVKLHLNGDTVHIRHMPAAHTDGDSIVYWEKANVLHMGDLYFNKVTLPFIDINSGGNAVGMLEAANIALDMTNDDTKVIPGHGPMATKADLMAYRDMLAEVIDAVSVARDAGKSLTEIQAMKPAAAYDTNPNAFIKGGAFVEAIWKSLENSAK